MTIFRTAKAKSQLQPNSQQSSGTSAEQTVFPGVGNLATGNEISRNSSIADPFLGTVRMKSKIAKKEKVNQSGKGTGMAAQSKFPPFLTTPRETLKGRYKNRFV